MIANNIQRLYDTLKITQYELAKKTGYSQGNLSRLVSGKIKPSRKLIDAICSINWPDHGYINRDWLLTGKGDMFLKSDSPVAVKEKTSWYGIPENCPADPVCQQICMICMNLPPDDKRTAFLLCEILRSNRESTKTAIRQNIEEFHELIRRSDQETDFKTLEKKRSGDKQG